MRTPNAWVIKYPASSHTSSGLTIVLPVLLVVERQKVIQEVIVVVVVVVAALLESLTCSFLPMTRYSSADAAPMTGISRKGWQQEQQQQ